MTLSVNRSRLTFWLGVLLVSCLGSRRCSTFPTGNYRPGQPVQSVAFDPGHARSGLTAQQPNPPFETHSTAKEAPGLGSQPSARESGHFTEDGFGRYRGDTETESWQEWGAPLSSITADDDDWPSFDLYTNYDEADWGSYFLGSRNSDTGTESFAEYGPPGGGVFTSDVLDPFVSHNMYLTKPPTTNHDSLSESGTHFMNDWESLDGASDVKKPQSHGVMEPSADTMTPDATSNSNESHDDGDNQSNDAHDNGIVDNAIHVLSNDKYASGIQSNDMQTNVIHIGGIVSQDDPQNDMDLDLNSIGLHHDAPIMGNLLSPFLPVGDKAEVKHGADDAKKPLADNGPATRDTTKEHHQSSGKEEAEGYSVIQGRSNDRKVAESPPCRGQSEGASAKEDKIADNFLDWIVSFLNRSVAHERNSRLITKKCA